MKTSLIMLAIASSATFCTLAAPSAVSLAVNPAKVSSRSDGELAIIKTSTYSGRVGCIVPKDETAIITVEAFFIEKEINGNQITLAGDKTVGSFEFSGDGKPHSQKFSFDAPSVTQFKSVAKSQSSYTSKIGGTQHIGVIVRAKVGDKIVKVTSQPNNAKWNKAAKEAVFTLL